MTKGTIGLNAGAIWNIIADDQNAISFDSLKEKTDLSDADLWTAIGWLARENKITIRTDQGKKPHFTSGTNFYY